MEIKFDKFDITGYIQRVNADATEFSTSEIMQFDFDIGNGKVDGHTPVESLIPEMILLWFIKENMISYIRNGGSPDKVFILPEEQANSVNHQYLVDLLQNQGVLENRHGNLVLTGKVDIEDIRAKAADMEYKELALYVTSNIAYALHIPVSRIPYMIGRAQSSGDAGGLAEAGYWSMIDSDQEYIETILNTQLFNPMGWSVKFKRHYKIDDLREVQALSLKADTITKLQGVFKGYGKKISSSKIVELMDLDEDDLEDLSPEEKMDQMQQTNMLNQGLLRNSQLVNPDKQQKAETRRQAATNDPKGIQNTAGTN
jgi:hypothetical protein